jgi:large subunit ribosomal protein L28
MTIRILAEKGSKRMAACDLCNKSTAFGRHIRHQHGGRWERKAVNKSRTFQPNVGKHRINVGGVSRRVNVCTRCLRSLVKD